MFAVGPQDDGRVVDAVVAPFGVAEAQHDAQFARQVAEAPDVRAVRRLGDLPHVGAELRVLNDLHDNVALQNSFGGYNQFRALGGGPAHEIFQLVGVGGLIPLLRLDRQRRRAD